MQTERITALGSSLSPECRILSTDLIDATMEGEIELARALIALGDLLDVLGQDLMTALMIVAENGAT
jgi:ankyrin repeat protein